MRDFSALAPKTRGPVLCFLVVVVFLAFCLLALAAPAARARIQLLWGDPMQKALARNESVPTKDLALLLATRERVISEGFMSSAIWNEMAMARLAASQNRDVDPGTARALLKQALADQEKALALSPADVYGWARHTYLLYITGAPHDVVLRSLTFEMDTAPYEPHLMLARVNMMLVLYGEMDPDLRHRADAQLCTTWKKMPRETEEIARAVKKSQVLETALRGDPVTALWLGGRSLGKP